MASSLKAAGQTVLGILIGATITLAVDLWLSANSLTVALMIGLGILAGALTWLGEQRAWVPITSLFVFTIADPGSASYAIGYFGLTCVGVTVGTLVNLLLFPTPAPARVRARSASAAGHRHRAARRPGRGLEQHEAPNREDWERRTRAVSPTVSTMHEALYDLNRSVRCNPRARRYRRVTEEQQRQGQAFQRMALLVEDLVTVLAEVEQEDVPALPFDDLVRLECAVAMRRLADLAGAWADGGGVDEATNAACASLERLEESVAADPRAGGSDPFVAGTVVTTLRWFLGAMVTCGGPTAIARNRSRLFR